jgi:hypothetical protein
MQVKENMNVCFLFMNQNLTLKWFQKCRVVFLITRAVTKPTSALFKVLFQWFWLHAPAFPFPKQLPSSSHVSKETLLRWRERGVFYSFLSQCFIGLAQMNLSILTCSTRHLLLNGTETKYLCVMGSYWFWSWSGNLLFHKQFSWFTLVPPRKLIEKSAFFEDVTSTFLQLRTI